MRLQAEQTVHLVDATGQDVGQITVERTEEEMVLGRLNPGPAFSDLQPLFQQFEDAVNLQALHRVDELDRAIHALGLRILPADSPGSFAIRDVQIWSDGNITFRLGDLTRPSPDGRLLTLEPVTTAGVIQGSD